MPESNDSIAPKGPRFNRKEWARAYMTRWRQKHRGYNNRYVQAHRNRRRIQALKNPVPPEGGPRCDVEDCDTSPKWVLSGQKFDLGVCDRHKELLKKLDGIRIQPYA